MNTLGQRISYYRKKTGLTQEGLAEKCSVTPQAVSKWENDISAPDISALPLLASLFNISCDELLGVPRDEVQSVPAELVDVSRSILKIRVLSGDGDKVNVNLPLAVAETLLSVPGLNVGGDALKNIDLHKIIELARSGVVGKLVDITSSDGDIVEIWVE